MGELRSFAEVREYLLDVVEATESYAKRPAAFAEGSNTWRDFRRGEFTLEDHSELGLQVTLKAARSLMLSADMMRGIAELVVVEKAVFSIIALIRPAIVAAARSSYLTDSTIDAAERVRRWANLRLESLVEEANFYADGHEQRVRLEDQVQRFEALAGQLGEPLLVIGGRRHGRVAKRSIGRHPAEMMMVRALVGASESHYDLALYRLASSVLHDHDYGQIMHFHPDELSPDTPLADLVMPVRIDLETAHLWIAAAAIALAESTHSFVVHQGHPTDEILELMRLVGGELRSLLTR
ncbi:hypothetical protein [Kribbella sp. NPDC004536]|uniref:hypothetical protein n=1 Tax=Kribbella sp. NPDC004536 TaxID=3364106 RepID=UPI00368FB5C4